MKLISPVMSRAASWATPPAVPPRIAMNLRRSMVSLGRRASASRHKNTDPLGKRNKLHQGSDLHFLHHALAVGFDCAFGRAPRVGGVLVGHAANDEFEDLPFARLQFPDTTASHVQLALRTTCRFMMRNGPFTQQAVQQMLSRTIGRDLVAGVFQTIAVRNAGSSSTKCTSPRKGVPQSRYP
jgi:hypothetical protein